MGDGHTRHDSSALLPLSVAYAAAVPTAEEWAQPWVLLRKLRHRGRALVDWIFTFAMAAYNPVRLRTLRWG